MQQCPGPSFRRQFGVGCEVGSRRADGESSFAFIGFERFGGVADLFSDEVDASFEVVCIDGDAERVAIDEFSDRATGECFGSDVSNACTGRDSREAGVCDHGDLVTEFEIPECGGDLVDLLHSGSERSAADQYDDIAGDDGLCGLAFDGGDRTAFGGEDPSRSGDPVDSIIVNHIGIDGGALDD